MFKLAQESLVYDVYNLPNCQHLCSFVYVSNILVCSWFVQHNDAEPLSTLLDYCEELQLVSALLHFKGQLENSAGSVQSAAKVM